MIPHRLVRYSLHRKRVVFLYEESSLDIILSVADSEPTGVDLDIDPDIAHGPIKIS